MVILLEKAGMIKCIFLVLMTILLCIQRQHIIFEHKVSVLMQPVFLVGDGF